MIPIRSVIFCLAAVLLLAETGLTQSVPSAIGPNPPPAIVIGFVGGFIQHDNLAHSEVQLAARLRQAYPVGVDVVTFESYHREEARSRKES